MVKEVMTAKDLAEYLGFSKSWIYQKAEAGALPATKIGNRWRFKKSVIDNWLEDKTVGGAKAFRGKLGKLEKRARSKVEPQGLLAAAGALADLPEAEKILREVHRSRAQATDRAVQLLESGN